MSKAEYNRLRKLEVERLENLGYTAQDIEDFLNQPNEKAKLQALAEARDFDPENDWDKHLK